MALRPITGHGPDLFPSSRSSERPISDNTMNAELRRLGYDDQEMTGHPRWQSDLAGHCRKRHGVNPAVHLSAHASENQGPAA